MKEFIIEENEAGQRFDKYLAKLLREAPKSFFYKMLRKKNITLNGKKAAGNEIPKTVISREYSSEWKPGDEPYYPVNDEKNGILYAEYKKLAEGEQKVVFGGRLGEYKYYDMDAVIASALEMCEKML